MIRKFQDIHTHTHTCSLNSYTILLVFLQLDHTNDDIKSYYQQLLGIKHGTRTPIEMSYRQKLQTCSAYMLEAIRRSLPCFLSPSLTCKWLFFQNVIHVQPHGGKTLIVLYQEMWLQMWLHVSMQPPCNGSTSQAPLLEHDTFSRKTLYMQKFVRNRPRNFYCKFERCMVSNRCMVAAC